MGFGSNINNYNCILCGMMDDKEKKLQDKLRFAGEKIPSMKRRSNINDYYGRHIYMVTMAVEGRRPLLGTLRGSSTIAGNQEGAPCVIPTPLGQEVIRCWELIPQFHHEVRLLAFQLMPDHLHGILYVQEAMEEHLGQVISGFKAGCNKAYRRLMMVEAVPGVVEAVPQHTGNEGPQHALMGGASAYEVASPLPLPSEHRLKKDDKSHGLLFERGYNDLISKSYDMLPRLTAYLQDNPRRLLIKREQPDLFRIHRKTEACGLQFTSMGNHFLLDWPERQLVEMSRGASDGKIEERLQSVLAAAHNGAVTYTAAISKGEQRIARTVREKGFPLVVLLNDGFPEEGSPHERFYKPGGVYFEACAKGKLLLMEPDSSDFTNQAVMKATEETLRRKAEAKHHSYRPIPVESQRYRFVALNEIGRLLVER